MPDVIAGLIGIGFLVLWVYCVYDVVSTDEVIVRNLPKTLWLVIVLLVPDVGSLLWLGLGRPRVWDKHRNDPERYGTSRGRPYTGEHESLAAPTGLDDASLEGLNPLVRHREEQSRLRLWEEQLKRREEELRRRELGEEPS